MLNEIDKSYARQIPKEAIPTIRHLIGNKFGPLKTRIEILEGDIRSVAENREWRDCLLVKRSIDQIITTKQSAFEDVEEFIKEIENAHTSQDR